MENLKPTVDQETILLLLKDTFELPISELTPAQGGMIAQALSFRVNDKGYILRFKTGAMDATYQKDIFIYHHFASSVLPVAPILKVGWFENLFYAISEKLPGKGLGFLSEEEYRRTIPSIVETLYAIQQTGVKKWSGYGLLDDQGTGMFPSWNSFIANVIEEERMEGFYGKWHILFHTTFLERDYFEKVYEEMLKLLKKCPEERYLVHGGYGYNNLLAHEGRVTAVLGWADAMYGDFVYDIAYLHQWPPFEIDYSELLYRYFTDKRVTIPNFRERLLCYQLYIGLDGLRFFAKTNNPEAYQATCRKLENLLSML